MVECIGTCRITFKDDYSYINEVWQVFCLTKSRDYFVRWEKRFVFSINILISSLQISNSIRRKSDTSLSCSSRGYCGFYKVDVWMNCSLEHFYSRCVDRFLGKFIPHWNTTYVEWLLLGSSCKWLAEFVVSWWIRLVPPIKLVTPGGRI